MKLAATTQGQIARALPFSTSTFFRPGPVSFFSTDLILAEPGDVVVVVEPE
jgi:hypothetical protein